MHDHNEPPISDACVRTSHRTRHHPHHGMVTPFSFSASASASSLSLTSRRRPNLTSLARGCVTLGSSFFAAVVVSPLGTSPTDLSERRPGRLYGVQPKRRGTS